MLRKIITSLVSIPETEQETYIQFEKIYQNLIAALEPSVEQIPATLAIDQIAYFSTKYPGQYVLNDSRAEYVCEFLKTNYQFNVDYRRLTAIRDKWLPTSKYKNQFFLSNNFEFIDKLNSDLDYLLTKHEEISDEKLQIKNLQLAKNKASELLAQLESLQVKKIKLPEIYINQYSDLKNRLKSLTDTQNQKSSSLQMH